MFQFLFLLLIPLFVFANFIDTLDPQEKQWLEEQKEIRIGVMDHWAPLSFLDYNNKVSGISPDILEQMNELLEGKLLLVPKNWAVIYEEAKQGQVHGVMDITPTKAREEFFYFTKAYLNIPHAIVSRNDEARFLSLHDLDGKTVALEKSFVANSYLEESYPKIKVKHYKNTTEALDALLRKEVDAYVGNRAVVRYKLKQEFLESLKIDAVDTTIKGSILAFGVSKEYPLFASIAQKAFDAIPSERLDSIYSKWSQEKSLKSEVSKTLALTQEEKEWLDAHHNIKFCADSSHMPYEWFNKENKLEGMAADYLALIENKLGIHFEKVPALNLLDVYSKARTRQIDFVLERLHHSELENTHVFSQGLIRSPIVVVKKTEQDRQFISDITELKGKIIGVNRCFTYRSVLQELYPELQIVVVESSQELFEGLATNRYDVVLASLNLAGYYLHALGLHELKIVGRLDMQMELGFGVRKDWSIFVSILNKTINSITNAEHQAIYKKWVNVTIEEPRDYVFIFSILGMMSFLPIGLFYWNYLLKKRVLEQTRQFQELNENLENLVEIRTKEYQEAQQNAQEATRAKSNFLANMSHELRTPMNSIMGMTYLVLQTDLDEKQKNYLHKIDNASKNLLGLINDILDFSKIEAGKMTIENIPFELELILENISDIFLVSVQEKKLELLFHVDTTVPTSLIGDPLRLTQVLVNLIGNAVKFTKQGEITLRIACITCDSKNATLRFDVRDTGMGISKEQMHKLFIPFSQADNSTTRRYGGTGLGLSISRHIIELMGGEMGVMSEENIGSDFYFTVTFPLQEEQSRLVEEVKHLPLMRILVVDDDAPFREILETMIFSLKFDVTSVRDGYEAIEEILRAEKENKPYELIFMDWIMPQMDGLETLEQIRHDEHIIHKPKCIMISGHSEEKFLEQSKDMRVDGFLLKPITPSTLYKTLLFAFGKEVITKIPQDLHHVSINETVKSLYGASLLLAEDNLQNQEIAIEFLHRINVEVDVANNGEEAIEKLAHKTYDGILMDCQMPIMDGYEATKRIRQNELYKNMPIIAMTANAMKGDREQCLAYGMSDYVSKPIDVIQLYKTLAKWIKPHNPMPDTVSEFEESMIDLRDFTIQGIDLDIALSRMAGNTKLLLMQLKRFCESQADFKTKITADIQNNDLTSAIRQAHTLKGLSGNIGALNLFDQAQELESFLKKGVEMPYTLKLLDKLGDDLEILLKNITKSILSFENEQVDVVRPSLHIIGQEKLLEKIEELEDSLHDLDASSIEKAERLVVTFKALGYETDAERFLEDVHQFDFEEALKLLGSLKRRLQPFLT